MSRIRYVFAVLTVIGLPPAILWWYLIHPFVHFWRRVGAAVSQATVGVLMIGLMGVLWMVRGALVGRDLGTNPVLVGVGIALMAAAAAFGAWRRKTLTFRILAGTPELDGTGGTLLTEGPYALMRNPRYVEVLVGMAGYALLANYQGVYLVAALSALGIHGVVLLEERELAQRFGDAWTAYRTRVPRYLPRSMRTSSTSQSAR